MNRTQYKSLHRRARCSRLAHAPTEGILFWPSDGTEPVVVEREGDVPPGQEYALRLGWVAEYRKRNQLFYAHHELAAARSCRLKHMGTSA